MRRPALALLLGCLLLVAGASALDGYDYYQTIEYAGCDQDVYQQDIVIHRSTGTAYNETAGGLETWHIYAGDHCQADYDDLRFTNSTGELAYYLWPDYNSTIARFAVRLEGADAAGEVTAWYGNPTATTTSDGGAVYSLFDQFDDPAIDTDMWDIDPSANVYTSNGRLYVKGNYAVYEGDFAGVQAKPRFDTATHILEMEMIYEGGEYGQFGWADGNSVVHNRMCFRKAAPTGSRQINIRKDGNSVLVDYNWPVPPNTYSIRRSGSTAYFYVEGTLVKSHSSSTQVPTAEQGPHFANNGRADHMIIESVLVRAYSATPPAATTFSGEQETTAPPATAFTASPTAGLAPLTVQFTDTSAGRPTSWAWTFGDGGTSTAQNPQHTYTVPGTYSVTLTATNEYGSTPATKLDHITVYGPITAQFSATPTGGTAPLTVQFTDTSTGSPTSWAWSFGDGNTSTNQNPAHTYTTAGTHTVTLTASHPYDSDTETKTAYITVAVLQPFPGLTLIPRDLTGNGLYTDINGNGRLDYNDLTVFFQHLSWAKTAQPIACFDFNGNGWLDYNDVITLFSTIMEEHT